jgi:hypothetical protein
MLEAALPLWIHHHRNTRKCYTASQHTPTPPCSRRTPAERKNKSSGSHNQLLCLIENRRWDDALERAISFPTEAVPKLDTHMEELCIHEKTVVETVCASNMSNRDLRVIVSLVEELLRVFFLSVKCNQQERWHTPLHTALMNESCLPEVIECLLVAELRYHESFSICVPSFLQQNSYGIAPIDLLLKRILVYTLQESSKYIHILESYPRIVEMYERAHTDSLLIKLFSMAKCKGQSESLLYAECGADSILRATRIILMHTSNSDIRSCSTTGCTPLHAAFRLLPSHHSLHLELLLSPKADKWLSHPNVYGDLPLHVACSTQGTKMYKSQSQFVIE